VEDDPSVVPSFLGDLHEMNASVRREGSGVSLARPASLVRRGMGPFRRRRDLRRALLTGVALAAPLVAAAEPPRPLPTAPLPPLMPVAETPTSGGLFARPATPTATAAQQTAASATQSTAAAAQVRSGTADKAGANPTTKPGTKPAPSWNPLGSWSPSQSLSSLFPSRNDTKAGSGTAQGSAAKQGSDTTQRGGTAATAPRPTATATPAARPASPRLALAPSAVATAAVPPQGVVVAAPSASRSGRFDPDFGPAGHVVSDAAPMPPGQPTLADDAAFLDSGALFSAAPEQPAAAAASEPVSLVSWLSKSYAEYVEAAGQDDPAGIGPAVCVTDRCCPTWQFQADALFLWQGNIPSRSLYVDSATQETVLDANQLQNKAAIGPRFAIIYNRDDCRAVEVNYFQVYGFNAVANAGSGDAPVLNSAGTGAFTIDNMLGLAYDSIGSATAQSSGHIKSFEVNLRRRHCDGLVQWISGFRWLEWGQNLSVQDYAYSGGEFAGADSIEIGTLNNLYGWQWGGDMTLWNAGRWVRVNGIGKAGVYYNNQASQDTAYSRNGEPAVTFADSKDAVAFVGEAGVNASVSLTRWLSWRTGYSFFWLDGMAVPARQLSVTDTANDTTAVNATGSVLLHGVTTGLEARW